MLRRTTKMMRVIREDEKANIQRDFNMASGDLLAMSVSVTLNETTEPRLDESMKTANNDVLISLSIKVRQGSFDEALRIIGDKYTEIQARELLTQADLSGNSNW